MTMFQKSVVTKYLKSVDKTITENAYRLFLKKYESRKISIIKNLKEEEYQDGFFRDLFVSVFNYTIKPELNYNLVREHKNQTDNKKADGAILKNDKVIAVIELKSTKTKNLNSITEQAFGYKNNQSGCQYVITSNFRKLRIYIDDAIEYEEFDLFDLDYESFRRLYLLLEKNNLFDDIPKKLKEETIFHEEKVSKQLYKDYSNFKNRLFINLIKNNPGYDKLLLFKKSQKLIDRFLFILFSEDRGLLPPNSIDRIIQNFYKLNELDAYKPLYEIYKQYFGYMNIGRKGKQSCDDISAYNGGLFYPDETLDKLKVDDDILIEDLQKLSVYDFNTEVDVNILGHIFENSLTEIEETAAKLEGKPIDRSKSKRKKDGVFYTPSHITKYIVEKTVGQLCKEKREEYKIYDTFSDENYHTKRGGLSKKGREYFHRTEEYQKWLLSLKIVDPACGSGAFLNQALNYLIEEHNSIIDLQAELDRGQIPLFNIEKTVLENNLFGVDINEESIEIAKLSLWLRTAQKGRKLSILSNNIKCGNSLISDNKVAGNRAFNWQNEFSEVFNNGGFDVVIGNPPYGAHMDNDTKNYISANFSTFQGNFEIYFFFIELIQKILKHDGKLGYITPDTWISIPQAQKLRELVLSNYSINTIVSYNYSVFEDASVNPVVFTLTKEQPKKECIIYHIESKNSDVFYNQDKMMKCNVDKWINSDDKQFQIWQDDSDIEIIEKIKKSSTPGSMVLDISQGIVPYSKENLSEEEIKQRIFHSKKKITEVYEKWVQGRAIKRYGIDLSSNEYLKYGDWLHRSRKPKYFKGKRILIQEITGGNPPRLSATIFEEPLFHDPGIISCLNMNDSSIEYLLGVINSKLISWYNLKTSPKGKRKTFPKVLIGDIRKFPIAKASNSEKNEIKKEVNKISEITNKLIDKQNELIQLLKTNFELPKLNKKLTNWIDLNFKEFYEELRKNKISLSLSEEAEWMKYFDDQKIEIETLKLKVNKIDHTIDHLVYSLYNLTKSEIQCIESIYNL